MKLFQSMLILLIVSIVILYLFYAYEKASTALMTPLASTSTSILLEEWGEATRVMGPGTEVRYANGSLEFLESNTSGLLLSGFPEDRAVVRIFRGPSLVVEVFMDNSTMEVAIAETSNYTLRYYIYSGFLGSRLYFNGTSWVIEREWIDEPLVEIESPSDACISVLAPEMYLVCYGGSARVPAPLSVHYVGESDAPHTHTVWRTVEKVSVLVSGLVILALVAMIVHSRER